MHERMKAIGELVEMHSPHVICFQVLICEYISIEFMPLLFNSVYLTNDCFNLQEVTPNIYDIFRLSSWWKLYNCSVSSDAANLRPYFCMLVRARYPV